MNQTLQGFTVVLPPVLRLVSRLFGGGIFLLLLTGCATDPWSKADIQREAAYMAVTVVDLGQTMDIKNHPELKEMNPILGEHPSDGRIKTHFAVSSLIHVLMVHYLPASWRPAFQYLGIGWEAALAGNNYRLGLRTDF